MPNSLPKPVVERKSFASLDRREFLKSGLSLGMAAMFAGDPLSLMAESLPILDVAYAGSMGSVMEGPLKRAAATDLRLETRGRGQGASALAQLIAGGSLRPDVFIPITASPMRAIFDAGKATSAQPIASTEMVLG